MKITVMLRGVLLVIVAVSSSWADGDDPQPGDGLDPTGNLINLTQQTYRGGNTFLSHENSIGERAQPQDDCRATQSCFIAGGFCVTSSAQCNGTRDRKTCKGGRQYKCCMPHVLSDCFPSPSCSSAGGYCVRDAAACVGVTDPLGCKGKNCKCCLPSGLAGNALPWHYVGNDSFVSFPDSIIWNDAQSTCRSHGLNLYHPHDILRVSEYLSNYYNGDRAQHWLGAKGDGYNQTWFDGDIVSSGDPWYSPSYDRGGCNYCLALVTLGTYWERDTVLFTDVCLVRHTHPLCG